MVFRMMEYDVHIALVHGRKAEKDKNGSGEFEVAFPKSAVLYLGDEENIPEYEACILRFQDGTSHLYRVPVMRVQGYSPERIEEKHLNILIPFLPIRFRKQIKRALKKKKGSISGKEVTEEKLAAVREEARKDITGFILECISVLGSEKEKGILSENACKNLIDREVCKGTDIKEIKKELMEIFTLSEKEAEEKINAFQI